MKKGLNRVSETASLLLVALWATFVLWWRNCPNPMRPRAGVQQALPPKSRLLVSPHSETFFWKIFQAFAPSPMSSSPTKSCLISMRVVSPRVSARWHHTLFGLSLMSASSFSYANSALRGSSHHCLPHWPVVQFHWIALLFQVLICRATSSALLPQVSCSRLESPVPFLCRSSASLSVDPSYFVRAKKRD